MAQSSRCSARKRRKGAYLIRLSTCPRLVYSSARERKETSSYVKTFLCRSPPSSRRLFHDDDRRANSSSSSSTSQSTRTSSPFGCASTSRCSSCASILKLVRTVFFFAFLLHLETMKKRTNDPASIYHSSLKVFNHCNPEWSADDSAESSNSSTHSHRRRHRRDRIDSSAEFSSFVPSRTRHRRRHRNSNVSCGFSMLNEAVRRHHRRNVSIEFCASTSPSNDRNDWSSENEKSRKMFSSRKSHRRFFPSIVFVAVVAFIRRRAVSRGLGVVNERTDVAFSRRIVQRGFAGQARRFVVVLRRGPRRFFGKRFVRGAKRRRWFRRTWIVVAVVLRTSIRRRRFGANTRQTRRVDLLPPVFAFRIASIVFVVLRRFRHARIQPSEIVFDRSNQPLTSLTQRTIDTILTFLRQRAAKILNEIFVCQANAKRNFDVRREFSV